MRPQETQGSSSYIPFRTYRINPRVQTPERDVPSSDSDPPNDTDGTDGLLGSVAFSSEEGSLTRHAQSPAWGLLNADITDARTSSRQSLACIDRSAHREELFSSMEPTIQALSPPNTSHESQNSPENGSICTTDLPNVEYYGPRSFMSFCSPPGVKWINSRLECPQLGGISSQLIAGVACKLKLNGKLSAPMAADPVPDRAWEYAKTYFDEAAEQSFGIVDRLWFEARLRKHLDGMASDDTGWFALRNAVWALGARLSIPKTSTYSQALSKSWVFFEKALSVHTEIILFSSSLPAVQALALMAYYAEGVSNVLTPKTGPFLDDVFTRDCASELAILVHLLLGKTDMLTFGQASCMYLHCEHQTVLLEFLLMRQKAVDDAAIDCQIPEKALSGKSSDAIYCHTLIELSRLCSAATKLLSDTPSREQENTHTSLIDAVKSLNCQAVTIKLAAERRSVYLDKSLNDSQLPEGLTTRQMQILQSHYHCVLLDINTPLFYPWSPPAGQKRPDPQLVAQIEASCGAVAGAARFIILATRQIHVDASCSALVSLFVPVYSFITQFIHILRCDAALAQSELDILDLALGYFANLKYATDGLVFLPFVKELASIASTYVDQQRDKPPKPIMDDSILQASQCDIAIEDEIANIYDTADSSLLLEEANFEGWDSLLPSLTTWDTVL
ncbi:hypothetical protein BBO_08673 [Beauveria brongniartii RCEF 3172]|uniref:Fungal transcriptional regulatory protein n=1 Tax=Beauveria brongniartii RCEF 3172 TaxID=1081107 RepID=A0A166X5G8_9HYPO|nr:hypothetical protein BBO_08673 [Beauveria brongniartii RCEF 3172]